MPPFPIIAVTVSIAMILLSIAGVLYAIRMYEKRVALEIYMARRMARKLKAEGAGIRKQVVVVRKKKVKVKRTSVQALRDASERDKFKAVLGGRAERSSRQVIDIDPSKRLSAKERFAASSAIAQVAGAARSDVERDAKRFAEETARAKAMLRGRAVPLPQQQSVRGASAKLGSAAPSLRENAALAASATPAYAQTLKQFNEARRKEEAERAAERKSEAKINFAGRSSVLAVAPAEDEVRIVKDSGSGAIDSGSAAGRHRVQLPPLAGRGEPTLPGQVPASARKDL